MFAVISKPFSARSIPGVRKTWGNISTYPVCRKKGGHAQSENWELPKIRFAGVIPAESFSPTPSFQPPTNTRRFETTEKLGIGERMMKGENERTQIAKSAQEGRFGVVIPSYCCSSGIRLVSRRPALPVFLLSMVSLVAAKLRGGPFCPTALLVAPIFRPQPIPGVSKAPKRWVWGK